MIVFAAPMTMVSGADNIRGQRDAELLTLSRKTMMGVFKGTRSSNSQRKIFVRRVREINVTVICSIPTLVVREGCLSSLGKVTSGKRRSWKYRFLLSSRSWDTYYLSIWRTLCILLSIRNGSSAS